MKLPVFALALAALSLSASSGFAQTDFTYQQFPYHGNVVAFNSHSADFNEDGLADVLVPTGGLSLQLSNSAGGLNTGTQLPIGFTPAAIAIGDFNGDKHLDIAALDESSSPAVVILYGKGEGTFTASAPIPLPARSGSIVEADFDGNGTQDLAVLDFNGNLTLLLNNGAGSFTQKVMNVDTPPSGYTTDGLVEGDFNGDGRPDIAWLENSDSTVQPSYAWSSLNTGSTFAGKKQVATLNDGIGNLLATDVDLDGKTDLIGWTNQLTEQCCTSYPVNVFYSVGDGTFTSTYVGSGFIQSVGVTDVNGDGYPDILITDLDGIVPYLSNGDRSFSGQGTYQLPGGALNMSIGFYNTNNLFSLATATANAVGSSGEGYLYKVTNHNPQGSCQYPTSPGVTFCEVTQEGSQERVRGTARARVQPVDHIELWANGKKVYQTAADEFDATFPAGTDVTAIEVEADGSSLSATSNGSSGYCSAPSSAGVNVCSPKAEEMVSAPVEFLATGTGASGTVNHLELWIDGTKIGNYTGATMDASVPVSSGSHTATIVEVDSKGAYVKSTPVTFSVGQSGPCAAPATPGVNVCSPAPGAKSASPVSIAAAGTGASGTVNHLELWIDGTKIGNYPGAAMSTQVNLGSGSHAATVVEVDSKGAYIKSNPVGFTVQ